MEASGPALVTGASRGIGRAVALELAARGFEVVATMRDPGSGKDLADAGLRVERLDVDRLGSFSPPDGLRVLVNNAGIEGPQLPLEATPIEVWRRIFETNVFGVVELTRRALPHLRETRGVICNITSCSILAPVPFFAAYRASKAAVSALGESLRAELAGTGVRVLEVQPGAIRTDMLAGSEGPPKTGTLEAYQRVAEHFQRLRDATRDQFEEVDVAARAIVDGILDDTAMHRLAPDAMSAGMLAAWRASDDETILRGFLAALGEGARD